jgi:hypothetical protein
MKTDLRDADAEVLQIVALQSGSAARIREVLDPRNTLSAALVSQVIALLALPEVSADAADALRREAPGHAGEMVDALLDPRQPGAARVVIAGALGASGVARAIDGLTFGLDDPNPDVRDACARALRTTKRAARRLPFLLPRTVAQGAGYEGFLRAAMSAWRIVAYRWSAD